MAQLQEAKPTSGKFSLESYDFMSNWEWFTTKIAEIGLGIISSILILVVGFWLVKQVKRIIERRMIARNVDVSVRSFLLPIIGVLLKIMVLIPVIGQLGINVSGFIAALGAGAVAVGLALQGSLANFAGGILIILFRPFKVGDYIVSQGHEGTVESISILYTVIVTVKGQVITLPNGSVFNNPITNFSVKPLRRLDINIGISYDDDFDNAKKVILDVIGQTEAVAKEEEVTVEILNFGDSSVDLAVRCFTKREDYWVTYWQLHRAIKYALDLNEISIPFPQTEMRIVQPKDDKNNLV